MVEAKGIVYDKELMQLLEDLRPIPGGWHLWQSVFGTAMGFPEIEFLFGSFRGSPGRLKFATDIGKMRQIWMEAMSVDIAIVQVLREGYCKATGTAVAAVSPLALHEWVHDKERPFVVQRLVAFVDVMAVAVGVHDAMRTFDAPAMMAFMRLVGELGAAHGSDS